MMICSSISILKNIKEISGDNAFPPSCVTINFHNNMSIDKTDNIDRFYFCNIYSYLDKILNRLYNDF